MLLGWLYDKLITWNGYKKAVQLFIKRLPLQNRKYTILDVGCGTGLITYALANKCKQAKIIGFDLSKEMIKTAKQLKKNKNIQLCIGNAENMNELYTLKNKKITMKKNSFDFIFTSGALEYTDLEKTYQHITSFLKKGGSFYNIAVRKKFWGKLVGKTMGFTPYSEKQIKQAIQKAGLKNIKKITFTKKERKAGRFKVSYVGEKM